MTHIIRIFLPKAFADNGLFSLIYYPQIKTDFHNYSINLETYGGKDSRCYISLFYL